jgi:hypothetical protein
MVDAVELPRMIVEDEETAAERRQSERDGVCGQQKGGRERSAHGCR